MAKPIEKRESYIQAREAEARKIIIKNRSKSSWRFVVKILLINTLIGSIALVFSSIINSTFLLALLMFFAVQAVVEHEQQFFFLDKAAVGFRPEGLHSDFGLITSQIFETGVDSAEYWSCYKRFDQDRTYRAKVRVYRYSTDLLQFEFEVKNPDHDIVVSEKRKVDLDFRTGADQVRNIIRNHLEFEFNWYAKRESKEKDD